MKTPNHNQNSLNDISVTIHWCLKFYPCFTLGKHFRSDHFQLLYVDSPLVFARNYGRRSLVSLQGSDCFAWKLELSDVVPEVYMLSKDATRDQISGHLVKTLRSYDVVEPIENNLSAHLPLIQSVVDKDMDLAKSKYLKKFLMEIENLGEENINLRLEELRLTELGNCTVYTDDIEASGMLDGSGVEQISAFVW
ncbi:hypothetical protein L1887_28760 [Cichorium endivia]|nr:hypothetical protein L1887_28760 [Cichorium endivia]